MKWFFIFLLTVTSQAKHYLAYEQFAVEMGYHKINFQCQERECDVLSFYKGNLMGKRSMKKDIVSGIRANFFANYLKIKPSAEKKCPEGEALTFKYYRNYAEKELLRCFDKEDYYSIEFQNSFSKVYKSIPPAK